MKPTVVRKSACDIAVGGAGVDDDDGVDEKKPWIVDDEVLRC